jgi:dihydroflavonol-4-reductase
MTDRGTVLVTGGSGFIGGWCVIRLLQQGYAVRATIRNLGHESTVRAAIGTVVKPKRLEFFAAELTADPGWDEAARGCDYVLHVASPVMVSEPSNPEVLINPAREGARRVIGAAIKAGVKRVILTSSVAASSQRVEIAESLSDENVWTDLKDPAVGAYTRSKTLAERAAWELIATSGGATTLATVNPTVVLGPVLSDDFSESIQLVQRLLSGNVPGIPRLGFNIVDVRDVADLHLLAMTAPEAAGQRFIAAGKFIWVAELATLLRAHLGGSASKVPTRKIPDFVVRLGGLFDRDLRALTPRLGRKRDFTSAKAQSMLGWRPRRCEETILDCANSLIATGVV